MIIIRQETPQDYQAVYNVIKNAFEKAQHSDGDEHYLVERLRKSTAYIPELSLIAEKDGKIAGHIMFSKLKAGNTTQLALAPLSVAPQFQKQGIGGMLIKEGHKIARQLGYEYSVLIGHPTYYPHFGYEDAKNFGFGTDLNLPENVFMACDLQGKRTAINAKIEYPKEFFEK